VDRNPIHLKYFWLLPYYEKISHLLQKAYRPANPSISSTKRRDKNKNCGRKFGCRCDSKMTLLIDRQRLKPPMGTPKGQLVLQVSSIVKNSFRWSELILIYFVFEFKHFTLGFCRPKSSSEPEPNKNPTQRKF
jgi:hypothetical protein